MCYPGKSVVMKLEWQKQLGDAIESLEQLESYVPLSDQERLEIEYAISKSAFRITPYYASLIDKNNPNCPMRLQSVPDIRETIESYGDKDPLMEINESPVPLVIHVYPDRVAFLVSNQCAMYCRHCLRKHTVKKHSEAYSREEIEKAINYIRRTEKIRDVLLTGGDPLMLSDSRIEWIIKQLRKIKHVEIIRIGTRMICTLPHRITTDLCDMLKKYHPIWINTQFNHPKELTEEVSNAVEKLLNAGIPVGNQSVLLKGINDSISIMKELVQKLVSMRIRPYYLYQAQSLAGTEHFITPIEDGLNIMQGLRGYTSGLCIPTFVLDTPYGKVPINPTYSVGREGDYYILRTYNNMLWKEYNPK